MVGSSSSSGSKKLEAKTWGQVAPEPQHALLQQQQALLHLPNPHHFDQCRSLPATTCLLPSLSYAQVIDITSKASKSCPIMICTTIFIQSIKTMMFLLPFSGFTPNPMYLLSRACGRTLLFNSVLVLVLVLRYSITILRSPSNLFTCNSFTVFSICKLVTLALKLLLYFTTTPYTISSKHSCCCCFWLWFMGLTSQMLSNSHNHNHSGTWVWLPSCHWTTTSTSTS